MSCLKYWKFKVGLNLMYRILYRIKGVFSRSYCCFDSLSSHENDNNVFSNEWAVFWARLKHQVLKSGDNTPSKSKCWKQFWATSRHTSIRTTSAIFSSWSSLVKFSLVSTGDVMSERSGNDSGLVDRVQVDVAVLSGHSYNGSVPLWHSAVPRPDEGV